MTGNLYCIGVGPGDPELMTLKAAQLIRSCPVLALPAANPANSVAYQIAARAVPEAAEKELLGLDLPMSADPSLLAQRHRHAAGVLADRLQQGEDVAFLTLGDPTLYCTFSYLQPYLAGMGITAQVVSGVPSFCAAAARLGVPLALGDESLHVVPAAYTDSLPGWPGTRVLMKSGRKLSRIKAQLKEHPGVALAVENCGLPGERVWRDADEIPEDAGYLTLLLLLPERQTER